jgi:putative membrane protein
MENIMGLMIQWILNALILLLCSAVIPGVHLSGFGSAMIAVVVIGLINAIVKPILVLLTIPITLLTLGLFLLVINALMFYFAGSVFSGFRVDGWVAALLGAMVYSVLGALIGSRK